MTTFTCDRCRTTLALHPHATAVTREVWADERDQHERGTCPDRTRPPVVEPGARLATGLWTLAVLGVAVAWAIWLGVGR